MNTWKIPSEVLHRLRNKQPDPKSELEKEVVGDRTSETIEKEKGICIELNYEHFDAFADAHVVVTSRDDGYFCVLPDELLSLIFTFVDDEQTYSRSLRVSKRLRSLVEPSWKQSATKRGLLEDEAFWATKNKDWKWIVHSKQILPENVPKNGIGCYSSSTDRKYEGEWVNDKREGWGSNYLNGVVYKGSYLQDKKEGFGIMFFPKGARYEGEWKNDRKEGKGCYHFSNGDHYDGEWRNDVKSGYGTYVFGPGQWEGDKYEGEWKNDKKTGQGVYTWKDGGIYDGEFEEDFFSGFGTYYYPCGDKYVGQWKSDKRCGFGVYTYSHGGRFEGNFKDGKRNGTGVFYWRNGDKFKGTWIQNSRRGPGTLFTSNGNRIKQEWDEPSDANYSLKEPPKHPEVVLEDL